jgi:hypothetical protein
MLDHLVYGVPHLERGIELLEAKLGVRAAPGGRHEGRGTHNALLGLGDGQYLEIIARDPGQPEPLNPRPFGLDSLVEPRLITWAAKAPGIEERVARARAAGYDPGEAVSMGRLRPDGVQLRWKLTARRDETFGGIVPFLIDWGDTPHPAATAPSGCELVALRAEHPGPPAIKAALEALGVELEVTRGTRPALVALVRTPHGVIELR